MGKLDEKVWVLCRIRIILVSRLQPTPITLLKLRSLIYL